MGRTTWTDVPTTLRQQVEGVLGGPVVTAESQASGWSPGSADRVSTAAGRRAFVKTVSRSRNEAALELHRREAAVMAQLLTTVQAPRLLDALHATVDGDDWVALVLDDVAGQHPGRHLDGSDTTAVLDALHTLPLATGGLATLPRIAEDLRGEFGAWDRMLADDADAVRVAEVVPPHVLDAGPAIARAAAGAAALVDGEHLVHADCRADNLLVDDAGLVWVVDWPWASVGAHWLDPLTYLLDTLVRGEDADVEHHLATHPVFAGVPATTIDAVLAGLAGLFFEHALPPAPPNMPTIRDFQRREGVAAAEWLLRRWAT
ncbi:phosphotransferase family protein [Curtobacterium flaccumfaciens]|uniref:phosphotransferase family protein n=1 Tax=Curtobacterium flaccumfaciens TaxID=2035 RepID=UPI00217F14CC|nr:phosphotransferase [Curtobacterium flaccumfaciens]MCS6588735.1 phosphotransferase [Curtobacterium flaccumfaciens pv. flaccumfaciens]